MSKPDWSKIEGIVFDIGNVLVDIDYPKTVAHFQALSDLDFSNIVSYSSQLGFFDEYERGEITTEEFISALKKYLKPETSEAQIIHAWNTMLVNYPEPKIKLLEKLKTEFKLFAFSNTNDLHVLQLNQNISRLYGKKEFREYFDRAFYSNEIRMRKPEKRAYEFLIEETAIQPEKLLFIDDKPENLLPAEELGIQILHLEKPEYLYSFFERFI